MHHCAFMRQRFVKDASTLPETPFRPRSLCVQSKQNYRKRNHHESRAVFFVWAVDAEKVCQLCKQETLVTAGYAECDNNRVASRHHILAKKFFIMSQGKFKGLSLNK